MTLTRRRLLAFAGGAASAVATGALAGCGAASGLGPSPSPTQPRGGRPKLSVWFHPYAAAGVQKAVTRWASDYQAADVTVTWVAADYEQQTGAALATGAGPDVFEWLNGPTADMIKSGQVLDLTDAVGAGAAELNPRLLKRLTYQGKIWAVPQAVDVQVLYYRKSLLRTAGLRPPKTLADLADAASALATPTMAGFYAGADGGLSVLGPLLVWSSGREQINTDGTAVGFADDSFYQASIAFRTLLNSPGVRRTTSADWPDPAPFINNETAMQWGRLSDLAPIVAAHAGDAGVLAFPAASATGRQVVPLQAYSACVSARASDAAAARAYVKAIWLDDDAKQIEFSTGYGTHLPAKPRLVPRSAALAAGPGAEVAKLAGDVGQVDDLRWTTACAAAYARALENVVVSRQDPETEFAGAAATVAAELGRLRG